MSTTGSRTAATRPVRHLVTALLAVISTGFVTVPTGTVNAEEPNTTATITVTSTGSKSIKVKPVVGSEGHFGLWDVKITASADTKVKTLDGRNALKYLKKGAVAEITFEKALKTETIIVPVYTSTGKFSSLVWVPLTKTYIEGRILSITEIPGSCATKSVRLGGGWENITVSTCRTGGRYEVIVNTAKAQHREDVVKAMGKATMIVTDTTSGRETMAPFSVAEEYAHASIEGAPGARTKVRAGILADGPHDGKSEKIFTVSSGMTL